MFVGFRAPELWVSGYVSLCGHSRRFNVGYAKTLMAINRPQPLSLHSIFSWALQVVLSVLVGTLTHVLGLLLWAI
jgi:hypothetical protein